ncbi:MAG TPA: TolC family protein [Candidatus Ozemobacteraceae bacterium]
MLIFRILLALISIIICQSAQALTLTEALAEAASSPALLESRLNVDQTAAAGEDAGKRGPDGISFEAENVGGRLPGLSQADLTLSFKRPIINRRKATAEKRLAALAVDNAKLDAAALVRDIKTRVQASFHVVIGLQNLYRNAQEISRINQEMLEATRSRVDAGASPEAELVKAQLDSDRVEVERINLEGQLEEAMLTLFREMGKQPDSQIEAIGTLSADLELPEIDELRRNLVDRHPQLLASGLSIRASRTRQELLKAENRPVYSWVAGARDFRETGNHAYVFAIEAELPNRNGNRGARKAAQTELDRIAAGREKIQRELVASLEEQVKRFQRTRDTVHRLKNQISPNAQKALEMALDGYRLGKTDQIVVLEARKAYAEVTKQMFAALLEMYQAVDAIEELTGVCLVGERH